MREEGWERVRRTEGNGRKEERKKGEWGSKEERGEKIEREGMEEVERDIMEWLRERSRSKIRG